MNMAKKRTNVIPIIEDARHPAKYRMLVGMVDVIFSDVAQPDQVWFYISYYESLKLPFLQFYSQRLRHIALHLLLLKYQFIEIGI